MACLLHLLRFWVVTCVTVGDSGGGVFHAESGQLLAIATAADSTCRRSAIAVRLDTPAVRTWLDAR